MFSNNKPWLVKDLESVFKWGNGCILESWIESSEREGLWIQGFHNKKNILRTRLSKDFEQAMQSRHGRDSQSIMNRERIKKQSMNMTCSNEFIYGLLWKVWCERLKSTAKPELRSCSAVWERDILPFASRSQRGTEDTPLVMLISKPLQQPKSLAQVLFIYFSSAFNTIKVDSLLEPLFTLNLNGGLIGWIRSFFNWPTSESFYQRDNLVLNTTNLCCLRCCFLFIQMKWQLIAAMSKLFK